MVYLPTIDQPNVGRYTSLMDAFGSDISPDIINASGLDFMLLGTGCFLVGWGSVQKQTGSKICQE